MGLNKNTLLIKELVVYEGSLDADDQFTGTRIGYTKSGTVTFGAPKEFAEFWTDTPQGLVRKDLVKGSAYCEFELAQFDKSWLVKTFGLTETSDATFPNQFRLDGGADMPDPTEYAYRLSTEYVEDGKTFDIYIRKGKIYSAEPVIGAAGNDYSTLKIRIDAFEDETISDRAKNLYFMLIDNTTSSS